MSYVERLDQYSKPLIQVDVTLPDGKTARWYANPHVLEGVPPGDVLGGYGNQCAAEVGKAIVRTYREAQRS